MMLLFLVSLLLQPLPEPPVTTFAQYCYTAADDGATVYFGYTSNTERRYVGSGYDFTTAIGEHPDAFAVEVGHSEVPYIAFTEVVSTGNPALDTLNGGMGETVVIAFDWATLPECGHPQATETPTPTLEPTATDAPCDDTAIDAATGLTYCYIPTESGVVPLPPASN